jgi:hypothetical protein
MPIIKSPQSGEHVSPGIPTRGWGLSRRVHSWAGVFRSEQPFPTAECRLG